MPNRGYVRISTLRMSWNQLALAVQQLKQLEEGYWCTFAGMKVQVLDWDISFELTACRMMCALLWRPVRSWGCLLIKWNITLEHRYQLKRHDYSITRIPLHICHNKKTSLTFLLLLSPGSTFHPYRYSKHFLLSNLPMLITVSGTMNLDRSWCEDDETDDEQPYQVHWSQGLRLGCSWQSSAPEALQDGSSLWHRLGNFSK